MAAKEAALKRKDNTHKKTTVTRKDATCTCHQKQGRRKHIVRAKCLSELKEKSTGMPFLGEIELYWNDNHSMDCFHLTSLILPFNFCQQPKKHFLLILKRV